MLDPSGKKDLMVVLGDPVLSLIDELRDDGASLERRVLIEVGNVLTIPPLSGPFFATVVRCFGWILKGYIMGRCGYSAEQIVNKLREADVLIGQGMAVN